MHPQCDTYWEQLVDLCTTIDVDILPFLDRTRIQIRAVGRRTPFFRPSTIIPFLPWSFLHLFSHYEHHWRTQTSPDTRFVDSRCDPALGVSFKCIYAQFTDSNTDRLTWGQDKCFGLCFLRKNCECSPCWHTTSLSTTSWIDMVLIQRPPKISLANLRSQSPVTIPPTTVLTFLHIRKQQPPLPKLRGARKTEVSVSHYLVSRDNIG